MCAYLEDAKDLLVENLKFLLNNWKGLESLWDLNNWLLAVFKPNIVVKILWLCITAMELILLIEGLSRYYDQDSWCITLISTNWNKNHQKKKKKERSKTKREKDQRKKERANNKQTEHRINRDKIRAQQSKSKQLRQNYLADAPPAESSTVPQMPPPMPQQRAAQHDHMPETQHIYIVQSQQTDIQTISLVSIVLYGNDFDSFIRLFVYSLYITVFKVIYWNYIIVNIRNGRELLCCIYLYKGIVKFQNCYGLMSENIYKCE